LKEKAKSSDTEAQRAEHREHREEKENSTQRYKGRREENET
jgi:hypothetical protein